MLMTKMIFKKKRKKCLNNNCRPKQAGKHALSTVAHHIKPPKQQESKRWYLRTLLPQTPSSAIAITLSRVGPNLS